jgi:hypothetical protein
LPEDIPWNNGMMASGSESLRIGEKKGIWGNNGGLGSDFIFWSVPSI